MPLWKVGSVEAMNSGLGASALIGVLVVLLVLPATTLAANPPTSGSPRGLPAPSAARPVHSAAPVPSPSVPWDPASGRSSPGSPHYHLSSASLVSSGCNASYTGEAWLAFDAHVGAFWIATAPSCVEEMTVNGSFGQTITAAYTVGTDPFAVAIDTATNEVYVTNTGSDNVSVLNDSTGAPVASIGVGSAPSGIAYDPSTGLLFVANNGSNNVSVINGSRHAVIASLPVGTNPIGVAVDPVTQRAFVANSGSDNLTVLSTAFETEVGSIGVGSDPYGATLDNHSGEVYVTNRASNNLSVVNASLLTVAATVPVIPELATNMNLQGVAYDPLRNLVWVGAGSYFAVVVNASTNVVGWYLTVDPSGAAVDPTSGEACLTNTANRTVLCLSNLTVPQFAVWPTAELDFNEAGLTAGTVWSVSVEEVAQSAGTPTLRFGVLKAFYNPASFGYSIAGVDGLVPTPSQGAVTVYYNSTRLSINVTFGPGPSTYPLVFNETGLATGTTWGVSVGGVPGWTTGSALTFAETNGTYAFTVASVTGYTCSPASGTVVIHGNGLRVDLNFSALPPPPPTYVLTFLGSGLPPGTLWSVRVNGTPHGATAGSISLPLSAGTYPFEVGAPPGYRASPVNGTVYLYSNLSVMIAFVPVFALTFDETGLPSGALWTATVDSAARTSSASSIVFSVTGGDHSFTVASGEPAFAPTPSSGAVTISSDTVIPVTFQAVFPFVTAYPVTFTELGLPSGNAWSVVINGTGIRPFNGTTQVSNTTTFTVDLANGTYGFRVPSPLGFFPAPTAGSFVVAGGPVNLTIQFTPSICYGCPPPVPPPSGPAPYAGALVLAAAGSLLVGVVLGLVVGYVLAGRRRPAW